MTLFEVGTAIESIIQSLKHNLANKDYVRFNLKARSMIIRYDNPLIIAYSDELNDPELIVLSLSTLQFCARNKIEGKDKTVRLLGDIIGILARRPENLKKLIDENVMGILLEVIKLQTSEDVLFVIQILDILIILLEYDDIRALSDTALVLTLVLQILIKFSPHPQFILKCMIILRLSCTTPELFSIILNQIWLEKYIRVLKEFSKASDAEILQNTALVFNFLLTDAEMTRAILETETFKLLCNKLPAFYSNDQVALAICQCLRKLIPFKVTRVEAEKLDLPATLDKVINKHKSGNLTVVQFAYMVLVILATSTEGRDTCRKANSLHVIVKCMNMYYQNSAVIRDSCIAIASLIYAPEHIYLFKKEDIGAAFAKGVEALAPADHKITLRVLASAYKEASLYDDCIDNLLKNNAVTSLMTLLNYQYGDKIIVSLVMATLVRLSMQPESRKTFQTENMAVILPTIISRYVDVNWIITRNALIIIHNLADEVGFATALLEKEGYKQVVRSMVHYLKNCKSIVLLSLEIIQRLLAIKIGADYVKDERVVKAIQITEQRFHKKSKQIADAARSCLKALGLA